VEETLRPGWSTNELLTPERFENLLQDIKNQDAVLLCIVDLFDIQGSLLPNLRTIAGKNPIMIAANKIDLLPKDVSEHRLKQWIYDEVRITCGMKTMKEHEDDQQRRFRMIQNNPTKGYVKKVDESGLLRHSNIHLVSCETGIGINTLITKVMAEAENNGRKVYVMGAANVWKSSFINLLLQNSYGNNNKKLSPSRKTQPRQRDIPRATVSNIPGTTLDFIKIRMPNGITMIDTPGLINKGILTSRLTSDELKKVIPRKPINAVTFLVPEQKAILLGGLASVELVEVST
jgi:ribosome biogenesis GTPase A